MVLGGVTTGDGSLFILLGSSERVFDAQLGLKKLFLLYSLDKEMSIHVAIWSLCFEGFLSCP